ncbi:hypothetical protein GCM10011611_30160 [Aliidongia dinghuensis]|uniref:Uncharacterized protein n=1 Tax=Aliidongia dinghuensis TaxID=1867774 RepID=A0A8J3E5I8_9PROT|nr:hypothetical protein [Aliidongia dinghuensis]GGF22030.1 hypothetical protein GCM10011611_30160 [Aliidongia dinghuensis]
MSVALAHAIPPPPPQPTVLPTQVQVAQGSAVPVPAIAVTANEKGGNAKEAKNETGSKPEQDDRRRGKLVDLYA